MVRQMTKMLSRETLKQCLPLFISDTSTAFDRLLQQGGEKGTGILDPADLQYKIIYQLTMRTVGATEIAEDPGLSAKTLDLFEAVERNASTYRIIFPWLPTLGWMKQMYAGAQLYSIIDNIARKRKAEGRREDDAVQVLIDQDQPMVKLLTVSVSF